MLTHKCTWIYLVWQLVYMKERRHFIYCMHGEKVNKGNQSLVAENEGMKRYKLHCRVQRTKSQEVCRSKAQMFQIRRGQMSETVLVTILFL